MGKKEPVICDRAAIKRALRNYATEFVLLLTPRGELVSTSEDEVLGYADGERAGRHIAEHLHPDDLPLVFDLIERARATPGFEETLRVRARRKSGDWGVFEATVIDATAHPVLRGAVLRVRDVTAEIPGSSSGPLADTDERGDRFLSLAEMLPLGILSADARGYVVFCNEAARQIFNLPEDQLLGRGWERSLNAGDLTDVADAAGSVVRTGIPQQVTFRVETGLFQRWAHAKFMPLGRRSRPGGWIATIEDITDRRRAESQLAFQATHDPLTGLPNRMLLEDRLRQACGRLRRGSGSVTVLFIDLDGFKDVNDNFGHKTGDQVLMEVARRLRRVIREIDTVARLGGDEFVVVCEQLPEQDVALVIDRIEEALAVPMLVSNQRLVVGASIGVACTQDPRTEIDELLGQADQDMYRVKGVRRASDG
ncbi:MAG: sensor domain-containing diguanylate cyclase [Acidimicrobiales bacterium]|nr:sensor domain-containing diguanylate cyclase [Acidimicrobiales bacterium]